MIILILIINMAYFYISCTKTTYQVLRLTLVSPPALLLPLLSHTRLALLALVLTLALALASGATHLPCTCACFASGARLALALALGLLPSPPSLSHASASLGWLRQGRAANPGAMQCLAYICIIAPLGKEWDERQA